MKLSVLEARSSLPCLCRCVHARVRGSGLYANLAAFGDGDRENVTFRVTKRCLSANESRGQASVSRAEARPQQKGAGQVRAPRSLVTLFPFHLPCGFWVLYTGACCSDRARFRT